MMNGIILRPSLFALRCAKFSNPTTTIANISTKSICCTVKWDLGQQEVSMELIRCSFSTNSTTIGGNTGTTSGRNYNSNIVYHDNNNSRNNYLCTAHVTEREDKNNKASIVADFAVTSKRNDCSNNSIRNKHTFSRAKNGTSSFYFKNYSSGNNSITNDDNNTNDCNYKSSNGSSKLRIVYVHPISQIILQYLQDLKHEWIIEKSLDQSLTLHRDGSFMINFVPSKVSSSTAANLGPNDKCIIHQQKNNDLISSTNDIKKKHDNDNYIVKVNPNDKDENRDRNKEMGAKENKNEFLAIASTTTKPVNQQHNNDIDDNIRIWTSYEEQEKKHWLAVRKGLFRQRFLLQDNLVSAWNGNRGNSLPERVHEAVSEMIRAVDRLENSLTTTHMASPC